jgi:hypothetical protein
MFAGDGADSLLANGGEEPEAGGGMTRAVKGLRAGAALTLQQI